MKSRGNMLTAFSAAVIFWSTVGCAGPQISFLRSQSSVVGTPHGGKAVRFDASVSVSGMAGKQLVYRVELRDRSGKAIQSRDGKYCWRDGTVAAARTFFVRYPVQIFGDLHVAIPTDQLDYSAADEPVSAEVGILTPSGDVLATSRCDMPRDVPLPLR